MNVEVVQANKCPCCHELYHADDGAAAEEHAPDPIQKAFQCGECEAIYEDRTEATECCK